MDAAKAASFRGLPNKRRPRRYRYVFGSAASLPTQIALVMAAGGWGKGAAATIDVRLTVQRLTRAAKARVPKSQRHAACPHLKGAMQAA